MKIHTTNYTDTFIQVAEDSPAHTGEVPPQKGDNASVANIQFDMISKHPYKYTSDDVIFETYAVKNDLTKDERKPAREVFFSKGRACLRASPLTKRYGWGVHHNSEGKVAIYGAETSEYENYLNDKQVKVVKAMRSKKA